MGFTDRAVVACVNVMKAGKITGRHVQDVLRCKDVDASKFRVFLFSCEPLIRQAAARIIGEKGGCVQELMEAALHEDDRSALLEMLFQLRKYPETADKLAVMIDSKDVFVKEAAVEMLRKAGRAELLFPLLFDRDEKVVERIRRYLNEQG